MLVEQLQLRLELGDPPVVVVWPHLLPLSKLIGLIVAGRSWMASFVESSFKLLNCPLELLISKITRVIVSEVVHTHGFVSEVLSLVGCGCCVVLGWLSWWFGLVLLLACFRILLLVLIDWFFI